MLLHDTNDVLMELAKSLNYCNLEKAATGVFAVFVVAWGVLRLFCFPYFIISSTLTEVINVLGYKPPYYYLLNILLSLLFVIHIYWYTLILRIAYIKVTTGKGHDIREDDD